MRTGSESYLPKLKANIRTPLQRCRNLQVVLRVMRDFIYGRTSPEVVEDILRRARDLDQDADRRGVPDPIAMAMSSAAPPGTTGEQSKNS